MMCYLAGVEATKPARDGREDVPGQRAAHSSDCTEL